jgi:Ca-activated chloride channel family protein
MVQGRQSRTLSRVVSGIAGLVAVAGILAAAVHAGERPPGPARGTPDSNCVGVVVASSQEKSDLLALLAGEYDATHPNQDGGTCVDVRVNTLASGSAEAALARGWSSSDGPEPTVWTPAATSWLGILQQDLITRDITDFLPAETPSLMQSPLVLAMPKPMAQALGWPNTPVGWADVLKLANDPNGWGRYGHPEWGRFRLGKTSPVQSTSGLHALVATYYAATGLSADLTAANVQDPKVADFVRGVEASVLHYGDTVSTFFDGLRTADAKGAALTYVSAVATEEKQVLDYDAARPRTPLVAVYPKDGTMVADHPYAVLNASWVTAPQRVAAQAFLSWLQAPERQRRFLAAGFRDSVGHAAPNTGLDSGIVPAGPALVLKPPAPAVLDLVRKSWGTIRKRSRLLLVLDISGSMDGDKLNQVKAAGAAALQVFSPDDEVGLWAFSDQIRQLIPIGPVGPNEAELARQISALQAGGGTALYRATSDAVSAVQSSWDLTRINAVVLLTDGQNSDPNDSDLDALLRSLESQPAASTVPVFTIGYGQDADLSTLKRISQASNGRSYNAPDPAHIGTVFADVISNF